MPTTFEFTARAKKGGSIKGLRVASDYDDLEAQLTSEGLFLITAKAAAEGGLGGVKVKARFKRKELVSFLLHLASYLEGGVPILSALDDYEEPDNPKLSAAVSELKKRVEGGSSLSDAMLAVPGLFSRLQVNMVKAGETTGRLDEAMREVIKLVEWEEAITAQIKHASTYPAIVLGLIGLIIFAVSIFALPNILKLLKEFHVPLPPVTKVFLFLGDFMVSWGWVVMVGLIVVFFGIKNALKNENFRLWWDTQLLGIPVIGELVTKIALSRFSNFFAAQFRAGIPIVSVLRDCEGVTGNARLGLCVRQMREGVEGGEKLTVMAERVSYFPRLVIRMFGIGEEAGNLEETLKKVSKYFDAEVDATIKRVFQLMEPAIMVVLAVLLVFVATAILLPMYSMIGGINAK